MKQEKQARVGFDVPFKPFAFMDNGQPAGMMIELVGAVLERAGYTVRWMPMPLDRNEPALFEGSIDALAFKGITPERLDTMDFSPPLGVSGAGLFRRLDLPGHDDPHCFPGLRIATAEHGPFTSKLRREYPELQVVPAESSDAAFQMLLEGRVELAALNIHAGHALAAELPSPRVGLPRTPYAPLEVSFAVAKGRSRELLESFSTALADFHAEGRIRDIEHRWLGALGLHAAGG
jgi:polar amino acid transport system substrate-binding protein